MYRLVLWELEESTSESAWVSHGRVGKRGQESEVE